MWANGPYIQYALGRILKANKLVLLGRERSDYLERAGGVSLTAGVFAGLIWVSMVGLALYAAFARHHGAP
jgi:hypothetical protein